jgi:hypothetical protein
MTTANNERHILEFLQTRESLTSFQNVARIMEAHGEETAARAGLTPSDRQ